MMQHTYMPFKAANNCSNISSSYRLLQLVRKCSYTSDMHFLITVFDAVYLCKGINRQRDV